MSRYRGPKNRIGRKFRCNIFGRLRDPSLHKQNPPGMHGARRKKKSDYGVQLEEKQKLKAFYGMLRERQLKSYYRKAYRSKGATAQNLIALLECRLDVVIYRMKFARTIFAAQQIVSHGHVLVNGKKVDRRSFQVKPEDVISIREKSRNLQSISLKINHTKHEAPSYFDVDSEKYSGKMLIVPDMTQVEFPIDIDVAVVCDFLQHTA